uniref:stathmin-2-like n=1 Tax=Myxine glutinosa TaxID=7769 RepID=UPI00358FFF11
MSKTMTAYKDKMKELSMISILCSCFYSEPPQKSIYHFQDMEVKELNKRTSGHAYEITLKPPVTNSSPEITTKPSCKQDISLEHIVRKLKDAQRRRQFQEAQALMAMAERREHERDVIHKVQEENNNFSRVAEERLTYKMEMNQENREALLAALKERLQNKERHAAEVRRNKELKVEISG